MADKKPKNRRKPPKRSAIKKKSDADFLNLVLLVSKNIRELRKSYGLTQESMAHQGGFNYRFYQKLESGKYSPNLYTLFRVANQLKVKISALLR